MNFHDRDKRKRVTQVTIDEGKWLLDLLSAFANEVAFQATFSFCFVIERRALLCLSDDRS